jgi:uncharacterized protein YjbI with pentapeptide repeats
MTVANEKQLEILKQGVDVWNKWRRDYPEIKPCVAGHNLQDTHLEGANFRGADLSRMSLLRVSLERAELCEADLRRANKAMDYERF